MKQQPDELSTDRHDIAVSLRLALDAAFELGQLAEKHPDKRYTLGWRSQQLEGLDDAAALCVQLADARTVDQTRRRAHYLYQTLMLAKLNRREELKQEKQTA